jgi:hypothetical protein
VPLPACLNKKKWTLVTTSCGILIDVELSESCKIDPCDKKRIIRWSTKSSSSFLQDEYCRPTLLRW